MKKMLLVFAVLMLTALGVTAAPPPNYFVDQTKLPFDAIPGTETQRSWGVHNGAGYRIEEGGTDRSYGLHVAKLAGIPKEVVVRAAEVLHARFRHAQLLHPWLGLEEAGHHLAQVRV